LVGPFIGYEIEVISPVSVERGTYDLHKVEKGDISCALSSIGVVYDHMRSAAYQYSTIMSSSSFPAATPYRLTLGYFDPVRVRVPTLQNPVVDLLSPSFATGDTPDVCIGIGDCPIPFSSDGASPCRMIKTEEHVRFPALVVLGSSGCEIDMSRIPEDAHWHICSKDPPPGAVVVTERNHMSVFTNYQTIYCHGGEGTVKVANACGCDVVVLTDVLDRRPRRDVSLQDVSNIECNLANYAANFGIRHLDRIFAHLSIAAHRWRPIYYAQVLIAMCVAAPAKLTPSVLVLMFSLINAIHLLSVYTYQAIPALERSAGMTMLAAVGLATEDRNLATGLIALGLPIFINPSMLLWHMSSNPLLGVSYPLTYIAIAAVSAIIGEHWAGFAQRMLAKVTNLPVEDTRSVAIGFRRVHGIFTHTALKIGHHVYDSDVEMSDESVLHIRGWVGMFENQESRYTWYSVGSVADPDQDPESVEPYQPYSALSCCVMQTLRIYMSAKIRRTIRGIILLGIISHVEAAFLSFYAAVQRHSLTRSLVRKIFGESDQPIFGNMVSKCRADELEAAYHDCRRRMGLPPRAPRTQPPPTGPNVPSFTDYPPSSRRILARYQVTTPLLSYGQFHDVATFLATRVVANTPKMTLLKKITGMIIDLVGQFPSEVTVAGFDAHVGDSSKVLKYVVVGRALIDWARRENILPRTLTNIQTLRVPGISAELISIAKSLSPDADPSCLNRGNVTIRERNFVFQASDQVNEELSRFIGSITSSSPRDLKRLDFLTHDQLGSPDVFNALSAELKSHDILDERLSESRYRRMVKEYLTNLYRHGEGSPEMMKNPISCIVRTGGSGFVSSGRRGMLTMQLNSIEFTVGCDAPLMDYTFYNRADSFVNRLEEYCDDFMDHVNDGRSPDSWEMKYRDSDRDLWIHIVLSSMAYWDVSRVWASNYEKWTVVRQVCAVFGIASALSLYWADMEFETKQKERLFTMECHPADDSRKVFSVILVLTGKQADVSRWNASQGMLHARMETTSPDTRSVRARRVELVAITGDIVEDDSGALSQSWKEYLVSIKNVDNFHAILTLCAQRIHTALSYLAHAISVWLAIVYKVLARFLSANESVPRVDEPGPDLVSRVRRGHASLWRSRHKETQSLVSMASSPYAMVLNRHERAPLWTLREGESVPLYTFNDKAGRSWTYEDLEEAYVRGIESRCVNGTWLRVNRDYRRRMNANPNIPDHLTRQQEMWLKEYGARQSVNSYYTATPEQITSSLARYDRPEVPHLQFTQEEAEEMVGVFTRRYPEAFRGYNLITEAQAMRARESKVSPGFLFEGARVMKRPQSWLSGTYDDKVVEEQLRIAATESLLDSEKDLKALESLDPNVYGSAIAPSLLPNEDRLKEMGYGVSGRIRKMRDLYRFGVAPIAIAMAKSESLRDELLPSLHHVFVKSYKYPLPEDGSLPKIRTVVAEFLPQFVKNKTTATALDRKVKAMGRRADFSMGLPILGKPVSETIDKFQDTYLKFAIDLSDADSLQIEEMPTVMGGLFHHGYRHYGEEISETIRRQSHEAIERLKTGYMVDISTRTRSAKLHGGSTGDWQVTFKNWVNTVCNAAKVLSSSLNISLTEAMGMMVFEGIGDDLLVGLTKPTPKLTEEIFAAEASRLCASLKVTDWRNSDTPNGNLHGFTYTRHHLEDPFEYQLDFEEAGITPNHPYWPTVVWRYDEEVLSRNQTSTTLVKFTTTRIYDSTLGNLAKAMHNRTEFNRLHNYAVELKVRLIREKANYVAKRPIPSHADLVRKFYLTDPLERREAVISMREGFAARIFESNVFSICQTGLSVFRSLSFNTLVGDRPAVNVKSEVLPTTYPIEDHVLVLTDPKDERTFRSTCLRSPFSRQVRPEEAWNNRLNNPIPSNYRWLPQCRVLAIFGIILALNRLKSFLGTIAVFRTFTVIFDLVVTESPAWWGVLSMISFIATGDVDPSLSVLVSKDPTSFFKISAMVLEALVPTPLWILIPHGLVWVWLYEVTLWFSKLLRGKGFANLDDVPSVALGNFDEWGPSLVLVTSTLRRNKMAVVHSGTGTGKTQALCPHLKKSYRLIVYVFPTNQAAMTSRGATFVSAGEPMDYERNGVFSMTAGHAIVTYDRAAPKRRDMIFVISEYHERNPEAVLLTHRLRDDGNIFILESATPNLDYLSRVPGALGCIINTGLTSRHPVKEHDVTEFFDPILAIMTILGDMPPEGTLLVISATETESGGICDKLIAMGLDCTHFSNSSPLREARIISATLVAKMSITIPSVTDVLSTGRTMFTHEGETYLAPVIQNDATQMKGRTGRVGRGRFHYMSAPIDFQPVPYPSWSTFCMDADFWVAHLDLGEQIQFPRSTDIRDDDPLITIRPGLLARANVFEGYDLDIIRFTSALHHSFATDGEVDHALSQLGKPGDHVKFIFDIAMEFNVDIANSQGHIKRCLRTIRQNAPFVTIKSGSEFHYCRARLRQGAVELDGYNLRLRIIKDFTSVRPVGEETIPSYIRVPIGSRYINYGAKGVTPSAQIGAMYVRLSRPQYSPPDREEIASCCAACGLFDEIMSRSPDINAIARVFVQEFGAYVEIISRVNGSWTTDGIKPKGMPRMRLTLIEDNNAVRPARLTNSTRNMVQVRTRMMPIFTAESTPTSSPARTFRRMSTVGSPTGTVTPTGGMPSMRLGQGFFAPMASPRRGPDGTRVDTTRQQAQPTSLGGISLDDINGGGIPTVTEYNGQFSDFVWNYSQLKIPTNYSSPRGPVLKDLCMKRSLLYILKEDASVLTKDSEDIHSMLNDAGCKTNTQLIQLLSEQDKHVHFWASTDISQPTSAIELVNAVEMPSKRVHFEGEAHFVVLVFNGHCTLLAPYPSRDHSSSLVLSEVLHPPDCNIMEAEYHDCGRSLPADQRDWESLFGPQGVLQLPSNLAKIDLKEWSDRMRLTSPLAYRTFDGFLTRENKCLVDKAEGCSHSLSMGNTGLCARCAILLLRVQLRGRNIAVIERMEASSKAALNLYFTTDRACDEVEVLERTGKTLYRSLTMTNFHGLV
jgi:hypothetical protein